MANYMIYSAPVLLLLSTLLFWTLIPGGPVETRRFSHLSPFILGSFNKFLAVLGLGSLVVVYFIFLEAGGHFMPQEFAEFPIFRSMRLILAGYSLYHRIKCRRCYLLLKLPALYFLFR
jgi:hypothetical protein